MWAIIVMVVSIAVTMAALTAVVAFFANVVAYENGRYDRLRQEPYHPPYHPEYHSQLHGREHA
jgi:hypothetical protein